MIRVTPSGIISVVFHIAWRLEVGASLELPISFFVISFTDAPNSGLSFLSFAQQPFLFFLVLYLGL